MMTMLIAVCVSAVFVLWLMKNDQVRVRCNDALERVQMRDGANLKVGALQPAGRQQPSTAHSDLHASHHGAIIPCPHPNYLANYNNSKKPTQSW